MLASGAQLAFASRARAQGDAAGSAATSPYDWSGPVSDIERAIAACLRESRRTADGSSGSLVARITSLPPPTLPIVDGLFAILIQGRVPKAGADDAPQKLSVPQRTLVISALARLPAKDVRSALEARLLQAKDAETRLAVVD